MPGCGTCVPCGSRRRTASRSRQDNAFASTTSTRPSLGWPRGATSQSPRNWAFITAITGPCHHPPRDHDDLTTTCAQATVAPRSVVTSSRSIGSSRTVVAWFGRWGPQCAGEIAAGHHHRSRRVVVQQSHDLGVARGDMHVSRRSDRTAPLLAGSDRHDATPTSAGAELSATTPRKAGLGRSRRGPPRARRRGRSAPAGAAGRSAV